MKSGGKFGWVAGWVGCEFRGAGSVNHLHPVFQAYSFAMGCWPKNGLLDMNKGLSLQHIGRPHSGIGQSSPAPLPACPQPWYTEWSSGSSGAPSVLSIAGGVGKVVWEEVRGMGPAEAETWALGGSQVTWDSGHPHPLAKAWTRDITTALRLYHCLLGG